MRRRFQRARKPEEKEIRRPAILKGARKLLGEVGTNELSLSDLARRSGVSKPNIYRYFESREEVLLQVWVEEVRDLSERLQAAFGTIAVGDADAVAEGMVAAFEAQPKLCELTSIVSPVLERSLSAEAIIGAKQTLATLTVHVGQLLRERLPSLSIEDCAWVVGAAAVYVAGVWPAVNPPPAAIEALSRPELAAMQPVFKRDFTRFLKVVFAGLARV